MLKNIVHTKDAQTVWNVLNGIFNVYKPPGIHVLNVRKTIIQNLCRDLNEMEVRPLSKYVSIEGPTTQTMKVVLRDSYADHPLVIGPRYQEEHFRLAIANFMSQEVSGVLICGINYGCSLIHQLRDAQLTKFYKVKGILGQARDNNYATGKIVEKTTWKGIKRHNIDRICASMQASHQKKMFDLCGLDIQSQAAYDLAVKGPIRPADRRIPMIYTIKCVDFQPPEFTLEMVVINEDDAHMKAIVAELGYRLHSSAHCSYIQCSQFGLFNVRDSLLSKQWKLQNIVDSISLSHKILSEHPYMLKQEHAHLVQQTAEL